MDEKQKKIFACIDGSQDTFSVCDWAKWSSEQLQKPIVLVHGIERADENDEIDYSGHIGLGSREHLLEELVKLDAKRGKLAKEQGKIVLSEAEKYLKKKGAKNVSTMLRHGSLLECLEDLKNDAQLIVIGHQGTQHQGETKHMIGSQVENVIRGLEVPIAVVQPPFKAPTDVLLAYDGSTTAQKALDLVLRTGLLSTRTCHLLYVGEDNQNLFGEARRRLENAGHNVVQATRKGEVTKEILYYCAETNCGLIVMGAYGHSRIRQFLVGSNTTNLLIHTKVPLVLLR